MFEGTVRWTEDWAPMWWLAWVTLAFIAGGLRASGVGFERRLQWAWTDVRLLFQDHGEGSGVRVQDVLLHAGAGMALALSVSSLWCRWAGTPMDGGLFLRLWATWYLLSGMRSAMGHLLGLISDRPSEGTMWVMHHRWVKESAAWGLAPLGLIGMAASSKGAGLALVMCAIIWALGWLLRQRRTLVDHGGAFSSPLIAMLYLCALEILPVAVLFRAWQG